MYHFGIYILEPSQEKMRSITSTEHRGPIHTRPLTSGFDHELSWQRIARVSQRPLVRISFKPRNFFQAFCPVVLCLYHFASIILSFLFTMDLKFLIMLTTIVFWPWPFTARAKRPSTVNPHSNKLIIGPNYVWGLVGFAHKIKCYLSTTASSRSCVTDKYISMTG